VAGYGEHGENGPGEYDVLGGETGLPGEEGARLTLWLETFQQNQSS
jgi:hypothetical protein